MQQRNRIPNKRMKSRMEAAQITIDSLANKAEVSPSRIKNLLYGQTKRTNDEDMQNIARILGCKPEDIFALEKKERHINAQWNVQLYADIVTMVSEIARKSSLELTKAHLDNAVIEIYEYTSFHGHEKVSREYAQYIISKIGG